MKKDKQTNTKGRRTVTESIDKFFKHCATAIVWEEYKKSNMIAVQPIIALIGTDILKPSSILVFFDGITYTCSSVPAAIDTCYKIFHVLRIQYPDECMNVWKFIQKYFYSDSKTIDDAKHKKKKPEDSPLCVLTFMESL